MGIESDPAIQGGAPVVRGTRIPVDVICGLAAHGYSVDEIVDELPTLTSDDVAAALSYKA